MQVSHCNTIVPIVFCENGSDKQLRQLFYTRLSQSFSAIVARLSLSFSFQAVRINNWDNCSAICDLL